MASQLDINKLFIKEYEYAYNKILLLKKSDKHENIGEILELKFELKEIKRQIEPINQVKKINGTYINISKKESKRIGVEDYGRVMRIIGKLDNF